MYGRQRVAPLRRDREAERLFSKKPRRGALASSRSRRRADTSGFSQSDVEPGRERRVEEPARASPRAWRRERVEPPCSRSSRRVGIGARRDPVLLAQTSRRPRPRSSAPCPQTATTFVPRRGGSRARCSPVPCRTRRAPTTPTRNARGGTSPAGRSGARGARRAAGSGRPSRSRIQITASRRSRAVKSGSRARRRAAATCRGPRRARTAVVPARLPATTSRSPSPIE